MIRKPFCIISILILCSIASAIPTTLPATAISSNNFTMNGNGFTGDSWFQWGMDVPGSSWARTPNFTPSGGNGNSTLYGVPVYGSTTYYFRACDTSGCGAELSLITPAVTLLPTLTSGAAAQAVINSHFDLQTAFWNSMTPYTSITGPTIFYAAILVLILGGMWLRTRGTALVSTFTMLCAGLAASSTVGLQLGLPPELNALLQAILYISLSCAILSWTVK
jgi:hypothetical protein